MDSSYMGKVLLAFMGGAAAALGGAFFYSQLEDPIRSQPVVIPRPYTAARRILPKKDPTETEPEPVPTTPISTPQSVPTTQLSTEPVTVPKEPIRARPVARQALHTSSG